MNCDITNNSDMDVEELSPLIDDLVSSIQDKIGFKSMPAITLQDDSDNAEVLLGKTAHYDPQNKIIVVYVTNRHPKDILRSIAHEFIHHGQNERGEFDKVGAVRNGYAQNDEHLRNMEKEAYLQGNMCFRDWEDGYKRQMMESIHRRNSFKRRNNTMKIHKWKNNELNRLLMEKFNLGEEKEMCPHCDGDAPASECIHKDKQQMDESSCSGNRKDPKHHDSLKPGEKCPECGYEKKEEKMEEKKFPDLTGDGKVTQADILKGRGVDLEDEKEDEEEETLNEEAYDCIKDMKAEGMSHREAVAECKRMGRLREAEEESFRDRVRALMEEVLDLQ